MRRLKLGINGFNRFELMFIFTGWDFLPLEVDWITLKSRYLEKKDDILNLWQSENLKSFLEREPLPDLDHRLKNPPYAETPDFDKWIEFHSRNEGH